MLSSRPVHSDNGPYFPTKTPGRGLKNRAENAHAQAVGVPMTVHGKGKTVGAPKTPFQPSSVQPQRLFKDQKLALGTTTRPLGDKTPLPNRNKANLFQTPHLQKSNLSKNIILEAAQQEKDELPTQRPSSLRKHLKHPRMSNFQTPMNKGNHWDISDGDIDVADAEPIQQEPIVEEEDDFDEVEYCPPKLDLPYQPPFDFDLPDYKEVGKSLHRIAFSVPYDDSPAAPEPDIPPSEIRLESWNMIDLPQLESDDPFHLARLELAKEAAKHAPATAKPSIRSRPPPASAVNRFKSAVDRTAPLTASAKPPSALRVGTGVGSRPAPASAAKPKPEPASARVSPRSTVVSQSTKIKPGSAPSQRAQPLNSKGAPISKVSSSMARTKELTARGTIPRGKLPKIDEKKARREAPPIDKAQVENLIGGDDFLFEL